MAKNCYWVVVCTKYGSDKIVFKHVSYIMAKHVMNHLIMENGKYYFLDYVFDI